MVTLNKIKKWLQSLNIKIMQANKTASDTLDMGNPFRLF